MATTGPFCMIEHAKWIGRTSMNTFPLQIILIGPFFKEICAENAKWRIKGAPSWERVKPTPIPQPEGNNQVFLWGGKTCCALIATLNVDNANRRQKKGKS